MIEFNLKIPVRKRKCSECFGPTEITYKLKTEISPEGFERAPFSYYKPLHSCINPECGVKSVAPENRKYLMECLDIARKEYLG